MDNLLPIEPGIRIERKTIPFLPFSEFRRSLLQVTADEKGAVVHFFAYQEDGDVLLVAILRHGRKILTCQCKVPSHFPSLTGENSKFHLFEREIAEQYGLVPEGHPWLKNVRFHANWSGREDVLNNSYETIPGNYPYFKVTGDAIHEVAVGPVHAGIIEPGHFRFQCIGEKVLHLEIQLGYQHRGIEQLLTKVDSFRQPVIAESIAGDTSIANSLCYSQAIEGLQEIKATGTANMIRKIALELERLSNHTGDLGALAGDVAFASAAAYFGRMRGEFLNLLMLLSGNRFGKGLIRPGGVAAHWNKNVIATILAKIDEMESQLSQVSDLLFSAHTVLGRFEGCGVVSREMAGSIGLVGFAGRASGLDYDVRFHFAKNDDYPEKEKNRHNSGDVFARAWVRSAEIVHSLASIKKMLQKNSLMEKKAPSINKTTLIADSFIFTMAEAWRGELSHCILTGSSGEILRYKVKDPSFHNWTGLALALRNEGISDFPLNNKSFNLSYCGFDL